MGIVYYLARPDNGTLFELGKWWKDPTVLFGDSYETWTNETWTRDQRATNEAWPRLLLPEAELFGRILAKSEDNDEAYAREVAKRLVRFADGRPIIYTSDASGDDFIDDPAYRVRTSCATCPGGHTEPHVVDSAYAADWKATSD